MPLTSTIDAVLHDRPAVLTIGATTNLEHAERRHVKNEQVQIDWSLDWSDGELVIGLAGRPNERPLRIEVVIEETVYSGEALPKDLADVGQTLNTAENREVIHTAFGVELVNQLVFVPQDFFD